MSRLSAVLKDKSQQCYDENSTKKNSTTTNTRPPKVHK